MKSDSVNCSFTVTSKPGAWRSYIQNQESTHEVGDLSTMMLLLMDALEENSAAVDFSGFDPYRCSSFHLVGALRVAHRARGEVQGWAEALMVAIRALECEGKDAKAVLRGILDD